MRYTKAIGRELAKRFDFDPAKPSWQLDIQTDETGYTRFRILRFDNLRGKELMTGADRDINAILQSFLNQTTETK